MEKAEWINNVTKQYEAIPPILRRFAIRAIILWIIITLANHFLFVQGHWPNRDLTFLTSDVTAKTLNLFYEPGFVTTPLEYGFQEIYFGSTRVLYITDGCNALLLYQAYLCFFLCVPGALGRKLLFAILGIATIFILNIIRCFSLTWLNMNKPEWTDFAHHYAFAFIVYAFIFILCVSYLRVFITKPTE